MLTLAQVIQAFLEDTKYQSTWSKRIANREGRMPGLRTAMNEFVNGRINLDSLRSRLDYYLPKQAWDSSNQKNSREWLLAELSILIKYHGSRGQEALRAALSGLSADNIGQRIEQFHTFLKEEAIRFRQEKLKGRPMAPLNSALMISLFASIIDPRVYFCDVYLRRGLSILRGLGIITIDDDTAYHDDTIEIRSFHDYQSVKQALDTMVGQFPKLRINAAWAEIFTRWVIHHYSDEVKEQYV